MGNGERLEQSGDPELRKGGGWVQMKPGGLRGVTMEEVVHDGIAWVPGSIPHGDKLEINVGAINEYLKGAGCKFGLKIVVCHNPSDDSDLPVGGVSKTGEAVVGAVGRREKKKETGRLEVSDVDDNQVVGVMVDLQGMLDNLEGVSGDKMKLYADGFERLLKNRMALVMVYNWVDHIQKNVSSESSELMGCATGLVGAVLGMMAVVVDLAMDASVEDIMRDAMSPWIGYMVGVTYMRALQLGVAISKYKQSGDEDELRLYGAGWERLLSYVIPVTLLQRLVVPVVEAQLLGKEKWIRPVNR